MELFKMADKTNRNILNPVSLIKHNRKVKNINSVTWKMILKKIYSLVFILLFILMWGGSFGQNGEPDYSQVISQADTYFTKGDYINAKASYQYASQLKPDEKYPKDRLGETISKLKEKMAVMDEHNAIITEADKLFYQKNYDQAKLKYLEAKKTVPEDSYPAEKIAEIDKIVNEANEKQKSYDEAVSKGEQFIKFRKYEQAKSEFEKAADALPDNQYPKDKIPELDKLIEQTAIAKAAYEETIASADRLFNLKYYENARQEYQKAADAKPEEDYPVTKIKEIDVLLVKKTEFDKMVNEADEFYANKELEQAKASYQNALKIYPSENYPKSMIDKINSALSSVMSKDELYQKSIADADGFYNSKDFTNAVKEYENASTLKPDEQYPKTRIKEINDLLAKTESDEREYNQSIQQGEQLLGKKEYATAKDLFAKASQLKPDEQYPKDKLKEINKILEQQSSVQDSYNQSIAKADAFYTGKNFDEAVKEYQNALVIIPGQKYALDKIDEINAMKSGLKEKDNQYVGLLTEADNLYQKKQYEAARNKYSEALKVKPGEAYPDQKIGEIDNVLAENRNKENDFNKSVATADLFYTKKEFEEALTEYQKANALKPSDKHVNERIDEINSTLSSQKSTEDNYNLSISQADAFYASKDYSNALKGYQSALAIKPAEKYPSDQVALINGLLINQQNQDNDYTRIISEANNLYKQKDYEKALAKYQDASRIRPQESYPKERIAEITGILDAAAKENQSYSDALKDADGLFALKKYDEAKLAYMKASYMRPKEQYPKERIAEMDSMAGAQKAKIAEYDKAISIGDRMMESKDYDKAKANYEEALQIMPAEQYPQDKLNEISDLLIAQETSVQDKYNDAVSEADLLFAKKDYDAARIRYQNALKFKSKESYPVQKIAEIDSLESNLQSLGTQYTQFVNAGDLAFRLKEYQEAKAKYVAASAIFPKEEYPITKIEEINLIFKSQSLQNQKDYDKAVADADKFFSSSIFDQALESYRNAKYFKPDETYPDEMIGKIMVILDKNAMRNLVSNPIIIANHEEKKLNFSPVDITDRKSNFIFIKARNTGTNEFKVVISFGKGSGKSGGFVLPIPSSQEVREYIIAIGKQYNWFSIDNDYVSLVPEGGTVELSLIKISRGD